MCRFTCLRLAKRNIVLGMQTNTHNKRMQSDAGKAGAADAGRYVLQQ